MENCSFLREDPHFKNMHGTSAHDVYEFNEVPGTPNVDCYIAIIMPKTEKEDFISLCIKNEGSNQVVPFHLAWFEDLENQARTLAHNKFRIGKLFR